MERKEKTKDRDKSKEKGSDFPFGDCQEIFEKMKGCCEDMADAFGCFSVMGKVRDEKRGKSERK